MPPGKADLILHPARFQIMQALSGQELTTQEIAGLVPSVPKSSIYRHLRILLEANLVEIATTQRVRGVEEKVYRLVQRPYVGPADMAGLSKEEHLRHFTAYVTTLMQGFADYLEASGELDPLADRTGYTEAIIYVNTKELDTLGESLNEAIHPFLGNGPGKDRHKHKLALITHPVRSNRNE
jgi:DNA-binding transcriptional ArsR family regulator